MITSSDTDSNVLHALRCRTGEVVATQSTGLISEPTVDAVLHLPISARPTRAWDSLSAGLQHPMTLKYYHTLASSTAIPLRTASAHASLAARPIASRPEAYTRRASSSFAVVAGSAPQGAYLHRRAIPYWMRETCKKLRPDA